MVAEHHDQRLVGGVIEVGGAAGFGQPHGDPVGTEEGDDVQGLPAGEGRIECTHIFYDEDPGTSSFADVRAPSTVSPALGHGRWIDGAPHDWETVRSPGHGWSY